MSGALDLVHGFVAGAGTDHLEAVHSAEELIEAVVFQAKLIQAARGVPILLPMPWLTANQIDEDGYVDIYRRIIGALDGPVLVHWLGEMFLPSLKGYFPGDSFGRVMALEPDKVRGAKLSLLDASLEHRVRAELLPRKQVVMTGDDFNFSELILGDGKAAHDEVDYDGGDLALGNFSHALLGVFDGVARPAGLALAWLAHGDTTRYRALMQPCEAYGQWVFQAPTAHYKSGLAFTAWLEGLQPNPMLVNHEELCRDRAYYIETARRAAAAGVFSDAGRTAARSRGVPRGPLSGCPTSPAQPLARRETQG